MPSPLPGTTSEGEDGVFVFDNVTTTSQLFDLLNHEWTVTNTGYLWRGQANSTWDLEPSSDRAIRKLFGRGIDAATYAAIEGALLQRFKLSSRGRQSELVAAQHDDHWWALGQHHGLLTPLLDWTVSPYVALFFAMEHPDDGVPERTLFMLHRNLIEEKANLLNEGQLRFINPIANENTRLLNQGGLLSRFPEGLAVEEFVRREFANSKTIVLGKINIPSNLRQELLRALNRMNINHSSLFPDLGGAAKFVNLSLDVQSYHPLWADDGIGKKVP